MSAAFANAYGPWCAVLGAGQGIGRAFASELGARGLRVLLVDIDHDLLGEAAEAARQAGAPEVHTAVLDLAAPAIADSLEAATRELELGLAVYTAMISLVGPFLDEELSRHRLALGVGCSGVLAASHVFGRRFRTQGRGGLILTSSLAGFQGTGWVAGYSACKAFDLALAEALWWELAPDGVDVLALCPGGTDTPGMLAHEPLVEEGALMTPEDVVQEALAALGQQHLCIPGEQNRAVRAALEKLPRQQLIQVMGENTRKQFVP
jgi:short-subunit dehydrogenase